MTERDVKELHRLFNMRINELELADYIIESIRELGVKYGMCEFDYVGELIEFDGFDKIHKISLNLLLKPIDLKIGMDSLDWQPPRKIYEVSIIKTKPNGNKRLSWVYVRADSEQEALKNVPKDKTSVDGYLDVTLQINKGIDPAKRLEG